MEMLCGVAVVCLLIGSVIGSRCGVLYYVEADGRKVKLGNVFVAEQKRRLCVKIPTRFLENSETTQYEITLDGDFAKRHFMEELFVKLPGKQQKLCVKEQVVFRNGLYDWNGKPTCA